MSYCTQDDILEQLDEDIVIQLTDDTDAGVIDADRVTRAIADADAEIDSYCGTRYSVPFAAAPAMIRKTSVDVAVYNLYARRKGAPEDRRNRYNNALKFLQNVSRGLISLGAAAPAAADDSGPQATTSADDRIFTKDTLEGY